LVDGRYAPDTSVTKPEDAPADWQPPRVYSPRSQEELDKIATLVKSAVGFDDSRGDTVEVVNMQFAEADFFTPPADNRIMGFERTEIIGIAETLALSVVAVLIILLVLRPLATHFTQTAAAAAAEANALSPQGEAALMLGQNPAQAQLAGPGGMGLAGSSEVSELDAMLDMGAVEGRVRASSVQKITELVTNHPTETISVIRQWMSQES
jgi:flagellar M-ring protein FliF